MLGGWFLVEAVVLSGSKGIVHPYYISALAPGAAAMAAAGALAFATLAKGPRRTLGIVLSLLAIAATIAVQIVLMHQQRYMEWFIPFLIAGGAASWLVLALSDAWPARRRRSASWCCWRRRRRMRARAGWRRSRAPSRWPAHDTTRVKAATASRPKTWPPTAR